MTERVCKSRYSPCFMLGLTLSPTNTASAEYILYLIQLITMLALNNIHHPNIALIQPFYRQRDVTDVVA